MEADSAAGIQAAGVVPLSSARRDLPDGFRAVLAAERRAADEVLAEKVTLT